MSGVARSRSGSVSGLVALIGLISLIGLITGGATAAPLDPLARIAVGAEPLGMAVTGEGKVVVVAAAGRSLHLLDPGRMVEQGALDLSAHGRLNRVVVDAGSGHLYVSASVKGRVLKIDPNLSGVVSSATVDGFPQGMAWLGDQLLVALTGGKAIAVIDAASMTPVRALEAGDRPSSILVDRNEAEFYVVKSTTRAVWVFDAATLKWRRSITDPSMTRLSDMIQAGDGRLLLLDAARDALLVMDAKGERVEKRVPLLPDDCDNCSHVPMAMAVSPDGRRLAVVGRGGWVSLLAIESWTVLAAARVGADLRSVVWTDPGTLFVASFGTGEVVVLDGGGQ